jgi:hypothetical protein
MSENPISIEGLRIPDLEKDNVKNFLSTVQEAAKQLGESVKAEVVGGVLEKEWPRKDIDITFDIEGIKQRINGSELQKAEQELAAIEKILRKVSEINSGFSVDEIRPPYRNHEMGDDDILESGGGIYVKPKVGTMMDIIRRNS